MANIYVRSTDGNNGDNGSTWALSKASLAGADGIDAAGDTIYLSQSHAESTSGVLTLSFAGTSASPTKIICGNDGAAPPTTAATTATVSKTGSFHLTVNGNVYCYGVTWQTIAGTSATSALFLSSTASQRQRYEWNTFILHADGTAATVIIGYNVAEVYVWWDMCDLKFGHTAQYVWVNNSFYWNGGSVLAGSAAVTKFLSLTAPIAGSRTSALVENVDLSNLGSTTDMVAPATGATAVLRNCKLPSGWSGDLVTTALTTPGRIEMHNCDSGDTNYKLWIEDYLGQIKDETVVVRTGGASDGVTPIAWKMVSNANTGYPLLALASPEIVMYNEDVGSSNTVTVEIIRDSVTKLTDKEVWLEASYLGAATSPLGTSIKDKAASVVATAADQAASSETWTTTGLANPNKQKLSVTFTPQQIGPYYCRVMLAKASTTIYVDPLVVVT